MLICVSQRPTVTEVRTTDCLTNHPNMLTDKELEDVTVVFRSLEVIWIFPCFYSGSCLCCRLDCEGRQSTRKTCTEP